jgi:hypothetical protein
MIFGAGLEGRMGSPIKGRVKRKNREKIPLHESRDQNFAFAMFQDQSLFLGQSLLAYLNP